MSCEFASDNTVTMGGTIIKCYLPKTTLTKVVVNRFVLLHDSVKPEAGAMIKVTCRLFCIYVGNLVNCLVPRRSDLTIDDLLNQSVKITGFLAHNANHDLVLHVLQLELLKHVQSGT